MTKLLKNEPQTLEISIRQATLVENDQQLHTSTQESKDDTEHLIQTLQQIYEITTD